jgi:uncharacterized protein YecE (DUF72 family)
MITIGTSGWVYPHWKGRFYPKDLPSREWFAYYAARFPTVEINNSFYRLPSEQTFRNWRAQAPTEFVYAVKTSRYITHLKRLKNPKEPVDLFWSRARLLGDRLGPVLFQLPPRFPAAPERLRAVLDVLPREMRAAFEFRDPSWETSEIFGLLDKANAAFVLADRPRARIPDVVTGGWGYIRFHQGAQTHPGYPRRKLERWADRIAQMDARDIFIYFNNDTLGAAIGDALKLTQMLEARGLEVARSPQPARDEARATGGSRRS